jgi:hypothetical protein
MITIDLTKSELFKNFTEIIVDDIYVDLHNEFDCYSVNYSQKQRQLSLSFKASENNSRKIQQAELIFKNVSIELMNFKIGQADDDSQWTIDQIYRGRFEDSKNDLMERSDEGKFYYYIEFCGDYSLEILSDTVLAELT